mmetsp:Transcript_57102/g.121353  ORF Transcript_57102/g.121353 Transcript_57102/m.121353 type:complete len:230 (+) Transcript_57102:763-1452(+)
MGRSGEVSLHKPSPKHISNKLVIAKVDNEFMVLPQCRLALALARTSATSSGKCPNRPERHQPYHQSAEVHRATRAASGSGSPAANRIVPLVCNSESVSSPVLEEPPPPEESPCDPAAEVESPLLASGAELDAEVDVVGRVVVVVGLVVAVVVDVLVVVLVDVVVDFLQASIVISFLKTPEWEMLSIFKLCLESVMSMKPYWSSCPYSFGLPSEVIPPPPPETTQAALPM